MKRGTGVLFMIGICCLTACNQEVTYSKDQLTGHWAVYAAKRDGRTTSTLDGAIFQFQEDGTMNTNISENYSGPYSVTENKIEFDGTEHMIFEIRELVEDTMSLSAELQGMHFILDLHKTKTESQ